MPPPIPDLTFVMDASGRYSHEAEVPLVFAGVAIKSSAVNSVREALLATTSGHPKKWSQTNTPEEARAILHFIAKRQLYAFVRIIWKTGEAWRKYFDDGQRLYEKGARKANEPMSYAKPMNTFKLHMFGMTGSGLAGFYMGRHVSSLPGKSMPVRTVNITEILDSDIQGETNIEICRNVLIGAGADLPKTEKETRLKFLFDVLIKTEQEEPLLFLADHIAGYFYSERTYGQSEENSRADILEAARNSVQKIPGYCLMIQEAPFDEDYILPTETFDHVIPPKQREQLRAKLIERALTKGTAITSSSDNGEANQA